MEKTHISFMPGYAPKDAAYHPFVIFQPSGKVTLGLPHYRPKSKQPKPRKRKKAKKAKHV